MRSRWSYLALAGAMLAGCAKEPPPEPVTEPLVTAAPLPPPPPPPVTKPQSYQQLGLQLDLPSDWQEGAATDLSAAEPSLTLEQGETKVPTVVVNGMPPDAYKIYKQDGRKSFAAVVAEQRDAVLKDPAGGPTPKVLSDQAWTAPGIITGRRLTFETAPGTPGGQGEIGELRVGETADQSLYLVVLYAQSTAGLEAAQRLVDTAQFEGLPATGAVAPLDPGALTETRP